MATNDNPFGAMRPDNRTQTESQKVYQKTVAQGRNVHAPKPEYRYSGGCRGYKGQMR